jgi:hypothetical protein
MRWIALSASLLVVLAAHAGSPGDESATAKHGRGAVDANNDGVVTREEASACPRLSADFDTADANKDGYVSRDEMHNIRMKKKRRQ